MSPAGNSDKGPVVKDTAGIPSKHTQQDGRITPDIKFDTFWCQARLFSKYPKLFKGSRIPRYTPANNHPILVCLVEVYQTINKAYPSVADPHTKEYPRSFDQMIAQS